MTMKRLEHENRRLRRLLRNTQDALRDAEETLHWVGAQLKARVAEEAQS